MMANDFTPKNAAIFFCEKCRFKCSKKSDWERHIVTSKHHRLTNANDFTPKNALSHYLVCECGKTYKHISSLCKHKKQCNFQPSVAQCNKLEMDDFKITPKMFYDLLQQNNELQKNVIELSSKIGTNNSHNTNCNNKTFNLQFFLNEQCKDAINIDEFVENIKIQLNDLETTGRVGYVEGVSRIINKNLNGLDKFKRPIHCSDIKREILYIKDENKWEKEDEQKNKIRKAIKRVATKNLCLLPKFKEAHPDCVESDSQYSDQYHHIIMESMGGAGDNYLEKENKIIRNILKTVTIDKNEE
jgi:ferritin